MSPFSAPMASLHCPLPLVQAADNQFRFVCATRGQDLERRFKSLAGSMAELVKSMKVLMSSSLAPATSQPRAKEAPAAKTCCRATELPASDPGFGSRPRRACRAPSSVGSRRPGPAHYRAAWFEG